VVRRQRPVRDEHSDTVKDGQGRHLIAKSRDDLRSLALIAARFGFHRSS
jgi:hypothetical protein